MRTRAFILLTCLLILGLGTLACGGGESAGSAPATTPAAEEPPTTQPAEPAAQPDEATAPETDTSATEESEPGGEPVADEVTIVVVAGDNADKGPVMKALADVVGAQRKDDFRTMTVLGKTTITWVRGGKRITVVSYPDVAALKEAAEEDGSEWDGTLFVHDPARSYTNRDEALATAVGAGATRIAVFMNVSDLLTDMEVYDLEAQVLPDELQAKGFEVDGMPIVQADSQKAVAGDTAERKKFGDLLTAIEKSLAGVS